MRTAPVPSLLAETHEGPAASRPSRKTSASSVTATPTCGTADQRRFHVTVKDVAGDIHWQKGLRCVDCHGGNAKTEEVNEAHAEQDGFRSLRSLRKTRIQRLRQAARAGQSRGTLRELPREHRLHAALQPFAARRSIPRILDQRARPAAESHGDPNVATCISCHDKPHGSGLDRGKHAIRAVADLESPVYRTHVAKTCATVPRGREADGRPPVSRPAPLGHHQYAAVAEQRTRRGPAEERRPERRDVQQLPRQPRRRAPASRVGRQRLRHLPRQSGRALRRHAR